MPVKLTIVKKKLEKLNCWTDGETYQQTLKLKVNEIIDYIIEGK